MSRIVSHQGERSEQNLFPLLPARLGGGCTIEGDHDRETIVVGNEPAVSGGLGSQVMDAE